MSDELTNPIKRALPSINDLYEDKELVVKQSELNLILNSEPSPTWIKIHPYVTGLKYLPIERIEYLLTAIFSRWEVEVKEVKLIANSVTVVVKLRVQNPLNPTEWMSHDGIGAMPIQVDKGAGATDFDKMKSVSIQIGAPSAESFAIKDAAEKLGKIFGKDLNRKDTIGYVDRLTSSIDMMNKLSAIDEINLSKSASEVKTVWIRFSQRQRDDEDIKNAYNLILSSYENT